MTQQTQTPSHELRAGPIHGAVWPKEVTHNGRKWVEHAIRIQKRYKDERTGEWKTTTYFRPEDMPKLALVATKMYEFVTLKEMRGDDDSRSDG